MGPNEHAPTAGEASEARTRSTDIRAFEWHWDGAFKDTEYKGGQWHTTYAANGHTVTTSSFYDLREEARLYYSSQQHTIPHGDSST